LRARTPAERHYAALFVLLKFPNLSPFVASGIPEFSTAEDLNYYFQSAWWCALPTTEYDQQGQEVPKVVTRPGFLTREKLTAGQQERSQLRSIGDGKSYLGKQVLQWAKDAPDDPRIPEALFIAFNANQSYKYGCGGWEKDPEIQEQAESILRLKYQRIRGQRSCLAKKQDDFSESLLSFLFRTVLSPVIWWLWGSDTA